MDEASKEAFLTYLRAGKSPPEAASMVGEDLTASMFRRLCSEESKDYDPVFAAEYLRARAEGHQRRETRAPARQPRTTTLSGHVRAAYLSPEMLDQFIDYVENGVPAHDAALLLEPKTTITQINRRAAQDQEFADRYAEAKQDGYPSFQEGLRSLILRLAQQGDYRAAEKLAIIHLPEWKEHFLTKKTEIMGGATNELRVLIQTVLPTLPDADLDMLIQHAAPKQIGDGEVIDQDELDDRAA